MANSATANMGPPPTREPPRRSGRSVRTTGSNSQSPEGSEPSGSQRGSTNQRPALASTGSSSTRSKKLKVEDEDHTVGDAVDGQDGENGPNSVAAVTNGNGRSKRKPKDKDKENAVLNDITQDEKNGEGANDDETRCVCGDEGQFAAFLRRSRLLTFQQRITRIVTLWSNARLAMSGSMGNAWVSLTRMTFRRAIGVNFAGQICMPHSSSKLQNIFIIYIQC